MKVKSKNPRWINRDRFILSKGHAVSTLYAILADKGFISKKMLNSFGNDATDLVGHPEYAINGIELSTGSLGHGLAVGAGMALTAKLDKKSYRTVVLISDAECQEGSVWETILFSAHHSLKNLYAIIDYNKLQAFGKTNEVLNLEPLRSKLEAFGWNVLEVNGHNIREIQSALCKNKSNKPTAIIAHTIGGKGVKFMENKLEWHYFNLDKNLHKKAQEEIRNKV